MKITSAAWIGLIFAAFAQANPPKDTLPVPMTQAVSAKFGEHAVEAFAACDLGKHKQRAFGLVIASNPPGVETLHALIALERGKEGWEIVEVPRKIDLRGVYVRDFLREFWKADPGFDPNYRIRCVDPKSDQEINVNAGGRFLGPFKKNSGGKHLCFAADSVYNSWNCYSQSARTERSFVQFNAD